MKLKPHILFVTSWWPTDNQSAGTFVELHLLALQSRGCKCAVLISNETTLGNWISNGFSKAHLLKYRKSDAISFIENLTIHPLPLRLAKDPIEKRRNNILAHSKKTVRNYIAREGKPDIIFHHGVFDYGYLSTFLKSVFQIPIWYMENSPNLTAANFPCANPFDKPSDQIAFAQNADRRFAVTQAYVNRMSTLFKAPFEYCPNVIIDSFFISEDEIKRDPSTFRFVNVAILDERKNQRLILESFAARFKGNKKFNLVIAGDGKLENPLRAHAEQLGIAGQCAIRGFQNRAQIIALLDASHCFVLSSLSETFGVVLIEAMARGLPVISSRIEGPTEIVNTENGLFFTSDNSEELGDAMEEMVARYREYKPLKIIKTVADRFGPDAVKNILFPND